MKLEEGWKAREISYIYVEKETWRDKENKKKGEIFDSIQLFIAISKTSSIS